MDRERIRYYTYAASVGVLLALNLTGVFKTVFGVDTAAIITILAGYKTFYGSITSLLSKEISADLALCIAVIAALAVGEYTAAAEAMFIILVGEGIESYAAGRTEAAIQKFVEKLPRVARVLRDGQEVEVASESLVEGDIVVVRAGERLPADGVIVLGSSSIDESTITGEPLPRDKREGDEVFSGTLNGQGLLRLSVTRAGSETTLSRVIALVEEARENEAPVQRLADRVARYFLPALLLSAAATFYFTRDWLRTVAVLIVACPCALILATPTAMVAAIGGLARRGLLVRSGGALQKLAETDTVLFDKTGTLTEGRFEIIRVTALSGSESEVLAQAAAAESGSDHTLARVIAAEARRLDLTLPVIESARVVAGLGAECVSRGQVILAGNVAFLAHQSIAIPESLIEDADRSGATAVFVAVDGRLTGSILLRDRIREGAREATAALRESGLNYQIMLTGDRRRAAESIAREVGIPNVEPELLPAEKLDRVRQLTSQGRKVAMIGDGLNDAPALASAHVGIAVSGASDITAEAADVVYLGTSLEHLPLLFDVSKKAMATAWQNIIVFAGIVNAVAVVLCATGVLTPIGAAMTHQLSSFFVMMNSLRLLRVGGPGRLTMRLRRLGAALWQPVRGVTARLDVRAWRVWFLANWRPLVRPAIRIALILLVLSGFYVVRPQEVGVIVRFGRKVMPLRQPGLHYKLPWPVEELVRIEARRTRVVEIGFRSSAAAPDNEPAAYEWNVQHRSGRFQRRPEESLMLAGDQNMMEVNAVIHYRIKQPDAFLFGQLDAEATIRSASESVLHSVATSSPLDDLLTTGRTRVEARVQADLQARLDKYGAGAEVLGVRLLDVHPSVEVVDAFRDVSGAYEEKNRLINEAEGYRNEQVALARGNGEARRAQALGYSVGRRSRAEGDAARFKLAEEAYRGNAAITETRLYLETMEQVLPGKKKMILDSSKGRRHLLLLEDGVELAPPGAALTAPPRTKGPDE